MLFGCCVALVPWSAVRVRPRTWPVCFSAPDPNPRLDHVHFNPSASLSTLPSSQHLCLVCYNETWAMSHDTAPWRPSRVTFLGCGVCLTPIPMLVHSANLTISSRGVPWGMLGKSKAHKYQWQCRFPMGWWIALTQPVKTPT